MKVIDIAQVCHAANREYCLTQGHDVAHRWHDTSDEMRASAIDGVEYHQFGDHTPEEAHEHWLARKTDEGWTHGSVMNREAKVHPCLLPYHQLPSDQQAKDALFIAIVRALSC